MEILLQWPHELPLLLTPVTGDGGVFVQYLLFDQMFLFVYIFAEYIIIPSGGMF